MSLDAVLARIDAELPQALDRLMDLLRIPSISTDPAFKPDCARAADWLNVIDEMLKAGLRKDAIDEWRKFRLIYPDYPVPEELARQIAAID